MTVSLIEVRNEVYGISKSARDITTRIDAEQRLAAQTSRLAEKTRELSRSNEELARFAYVASHDLQEPVRTVRSFAELLERRYADRLDGEALEFLRYVTNGATRMQQLVQQLLKLSRVETHGEAFDTVDCESLLHDVTEALQVAIQEASAVVHTDRLPQVFGDRGQLEQLFLNLIGNALKYRGESAPRIVVHATRDNDAWTFSVEDNGIGIEPEYFDRVFVAFQRLHTNDEYAGKGMGLAICKKTVERHSGTMWIKSEPGTGATFYFTIPVADQAGGIETTRAVAGQRDSEAGEARR